MKLLVEVKCINGINRTIRGRSSAYCAKKMKREKKIVLSCACLILTAGLVLSGCNSKKQETGEVDQKVETEVGVEETTAPVATPESRKLDAAFDEEFVINKYETLYVGRDDVKITFTEVFNYEDNRVGFTYALNVGNERYDGEVFWDEKSGISVLQGRFSMNRVLCVDVNREDESLTLIVTETTDLKKPMELSGNPEDEYITTQPEYVEMDDFILFLDKGIKIYGNTPEQIETIFELVEKETGLNRDGEPGYTVLTPPGPGWMFGSDTFMGIDPDLKKYHIYVVPFEKSSPTGGYGHLIINPMDLEIAAGDGYAIVHEYTHSLHVANGPWMSQFLTEGYSTYITKQITAKDEIIPFKFDSDANYANYKDEITKENAEKIILENEEYCFENYQYGYRMMHFLMETYGEDIFRKLLDEACVMVAEDWNEIYKEETIECLKRCTSDTVFEEFGEWMNVNKDRFE